MTKNNNFKWLTDDIDQSMVLRGAYKRYGVISSYGIFNVDEVLETDYDRLEIETGNINDLTNLLTLGIVRFVCVGDRSDIIEIPFRKLYLLYQNGNKLGENSEKIISLSDLDAFSVIDGTVKNDLFVFPFLVNTPSKNLMDVMKVAYEYNSYGMQEQTDALARITIINHQRLLNEEKERKLR